MNEKRRDPDFPFRRRRGEKKENENFLNSLSHEGSGGRFPPARIGRKKKGRSQ